MYFTSSPTVTIDDSLITDNASYGLGIGGRGGALTVRNTTFSLNDDAGVYAFGASYQVATDFGAAGDPGGNQFVDNVQNPIDDPTAQLNVDWTTYNDPFLCVGCTFVQGATTSTPTGCEYGKATSTPAGATYPDWRVIFGLIRFNPTGECD